jgi:hypothetical protein
MYTALGPRQGASNGTTEERKAVAPVTLIISILLIVLGVGSYFGTDRVSITALIPTFIGLPLLLLGLLAFKDSLRKHAMHLAAVLGLLGCLGGIVRGVQRFSALTGDDPMKRYAVIETWLMAILCGLFVALCVRSFVIARMRRTQKPSA